MYVYVYVRLSILFGQSVGRIWRKLVVGNPTITKKLRLKPNRNVGFNPRR